MFPAKEPSFMASFLYVAVEKRSCLCIRLEMNDRIALSKNGTNPIGMDRK